MKSVVVSVAVALFTVAASTSQAQVESQAATSQQEVALQFMKQGIDRCQKAHRLSRSDLDKADAAFSDYQRFKRRAEIIAPAIARSSSSLAREVERCRHVKENIQRARYMPTLRTGIEACFASRSAMQKGNFFQAEQNLRTFAEHKRVALASAPTLKSMKAIARDLRQCERLQEKFAEVSSQLHELDDQYQDLTLSLEGALLSCRIAEGGTSSEKPSPKSLTVIQRHLKRAQGLSWQAGKQYRGLKQQQRSLRHPQQDQVETLISQVNRCTDLVQVAAKQVEKRLTRQLALNTDSNDSASSAGSSSNEPATGEFHTVPIPPERAVASAHN